MHPKDADRIVDSVHPDQTDPNLQQSNLGWHCLPRPVCLEMQSTCKYLFFHLGSFSWLTWPISLLSSLKMGIILKWKSFITGFRYITLSFHRYMQKQACPQGQILFSMLKNVLRNVKEPRRNHSCLPPKDGGCYWSRNVPRHGAQETLEGVSYQSGTFVQIF